MFEEHTLDHTNKTHGSNHCAFAPKQFLFQNLLFAHTGYVGKIIFVKCGLCTLFLL